MSLRLFSRFLSKKSISERLRSRRQGSETTPLWGVVFPFGHFRIFGGWFFWENGMVLPKSVQCTHTKLVTAWKCCILAQIIQKVFSKEIEYLLLLIPLQSKCESEWFVVDVLASNNNLCFSASMFLALKKICSYSIFSELFLNRLTIFLYYQWPNIYIIENLEINFGFLKNHPPLKKVQSDPCSLDVKESFAYLYHVLRMIFGAHTAV